MKPNTICCLMITFFTSTLGHTNSTIPTTITTTTTTYYYYYYYQELSSVLQTLLLMESLKELKLG